MRSIILKKKYNLRFSNAFILPDSGINITYSTLNIDLLGIDSIDKTKIIATFCNDIEISQELEDILLDPSNISIDLEVLDSTELSTIIDDNSSKINSAIIYLKNAIGLKYGSYLVMQSFNNYTLLIKDKEIKINPKLYGHISVLPKITALNINADKLEKQYWIDFLLQGEYYLNSYKQYKTAFLLTITALEIGLKEYLSNKYSELDYYFENVPSPPVDKLVKFIEKTDSRLNFESSSDTNLNDCMNIRNKIIHSGNTTIIIMDGRKIKLKCGDKIVKDLKGFIKDIKEYLCKIHNINFDY